MLTHDCIVRGVQLAQHELWQQRGDITTLIGNQTRVLSEVGGPKALSRSKRELRYRSGADAELLGHFMTVSLFNMQHPQDLLPARRQRTQRTPNQLSSQDRLRGIRRRFLNTIAHRLLAGDTAPIHVDCPISDCSKQIGLHSSGGSTARAQHREEPCEHLTH
ncbi:MAG: hypothetical protein L6256_05960 [Propionicimonas sp.]|nr:hypothetical protein [Propionicimonas sp.]MCG2804974.1 hypothetical protein [Propionicimonas sp.]